MDNGLQENISLKILLVEDDPPSRFFASTVIKINHNNLITAENGAEGFQLFIDEKPDIIISDINMPQMDGLQMSRKIREINPDAQIILTTALESKQQLLEAIDIGINHYIVKPVNRDRLLTAINRAATDINIKVQLKRQFDHINKLSRALQESPTPIMILDDKGIIEYVNNKFSSLFRMKFEIIEGRHYKECLPENELSISLDRVFSNDKETEILKENIICHSLDKTTIWFSLSIFTVRNLENELKNYVVELEDTTQQELARKTLEETNIYLENRVSQRTADLLSANELLQKEISIRIATEKELIKARDVAEAANKAKSSFLAKVSHELRTPMNGIIGLTSILFSTELNQKQKKFLEMVKYSADNLLNIINDILDYSKLEAGKMKIKNEPFNIIATIERVVELLLTNANEKELSLRYSISKDVPRVLVGDSKRIEQVLINLIGNAIKFTEKGYVKLDVEVTNEKGSDIEIQFSIEDTGIGIAKDKQHFLFQSFSQVEDTMTRKHGGTGLGLVICDELVKLMSGKIWFESEFGQGSRFFFKIPLKQKTSLNNKEIKEHNEIEIASEVAEKYPEVSLNILIAEDSLINQEVLKQVFMQKQWIITSVLNGKEALEIYKSGNFDIILMDVQMPLMDGYEATRCIREFEKTIGNKRTPIIGLTAHSADSDKELCIEAGMDTFITKPFKWQDVFDAIYTLTGTNSSFRITSYPNVDLNQLKISINNNTMLLKNLIRFFIDNYTKEIDELENFIINKEARKANELAHKLKSECGNFGAIEAVNLARTIEISAKQGNMEEAKKAFYKLRNELRIVEENLKKEIQ